MNIYEGFDVMGSGLPINISKGLILNTSGLKCPPPSPPSPPSPPPPSPENGCPSFTASNTIPILKTKYCNTPNESGTPGFPLTTQILKDKNGDDIVDTITNSSMTIDLAQNNNYIFARAGSDPKGANIKLLGITLNYEGDPTSLVNGNYGTDLDSNVIEKCIGLPSAIPDPSSNLYKSLTIGTVETKDNYDKNMCSYKDTNDSSVNTGYFKNDSLENLKKCQQPGSNIFGPGLPGGLCYTRSDGKCKNTCMYGSVIENYASNNEESSSGTCIKLSDIKKNPNNYNSILNDSIFRYSGWYDSKNDQNYAKLKKHIENIKNIHDTTSGDGKVDWEVGLCENFNNQYYKCIDNKCKAVSQIKDDNNVINVAGDTTDLSLKSDCVKFNKDITNNENHYAANFNTPRIYPEARPSYDKSDPDDLTFLLSKCKQFTFDFKYENVFLDSDGSQINSIFITFWFPPACDKSEKNEALIPNKDGSTPFKNAYAYCKNGSTTFDTKTFPTGLVNSEQNARQLVDLELKVGNTLTITLDDKTYNSFRTIYNKNAYKDDGTYSKEHSIEYGINGRLMYTKIPIKKNKNYPNNAEFNILYLDKIINDYTGIEDFEYTIDVGFHGDEGTKKFDNWRQPTNPFVSNFSAVDGLRNIPLILNFYKNNNFIRDSKCLFTEDSKDNKLIDMCKNVYKHNNQTNNEDFDNIIKYTSENYNGITNIVEYSNHKKQYETMGFTCLSPKVLCNYDDNIIKDYFNVNSIDITDVEKSKKFDDVPECNDMVKKWWQIYEYYNKRTDVNAIKIKNSLFYVLGPINREFFIGLSGGMGGILENNEPYSNAKFNGITHYYPSGKDPTIIKTTATSMTQKWESLKEAGKGLSCMDHKCSPYIIRAILQGYGLFIPWDETKLLSDSESDWHEWINTHFNSIQYYNKPICNYVQQPIQDEKYNFDIINNRKNISKEYQGLYDELMNLVFIDDKKLPYLHYSDFIKGQTTEVIGEKSVGFGCPQYSFSYDDSCDPPSTSVKSLDADKLEVIFNPSQ